MTIVRSTRYDHGCEPPPVDALPDGVRVGDTWECDECTRSALLIVGHPKDGEAAGAFAWLADPKYDRPRGRLDRWRRRRAATRG